jgi:AAA+ ATPase superfamily predicted ATPase
LTKVNYNRGETRMAKYPKQVYVKRETGGKERWLSTFEEEVDAVDDGEPTEIAVYKLEKRYKAEKVVRVVTRGKK